MGVFGSINNIIRTKLELIGALKESGIVIEAAFKDLSGSRDLNTDSLSINLYSVGDSDELDLQRTWPYLVESDPDQDRKYSISLGTDTNELKMMVNEIRKIENNFAVVSLAPLFRASSLQIFLIFYTSSKIGNTC